MPHGNAPSTHILKPAMVGLTDQAFNKIHELQPDHLTRRIDGCRLTGRIMAQALRELLETVLREAGVLAGKFEQSRVDSMIPGQIRDRITATCNRLH